MTGISGILARVLRRYGLHSRVLEERLRPGWNEPNRGSASRQPSSHELGPDLELCIQEYLKSLSDPELKAVFRRVMIKSFGSQRQRD